jgi:hypothetical protein
MPTLDQGRLLRALATLQSGRLSTKPQGGEVLVFAEEWDRAFSPDVLTLLDVYYQASQQGHPVPPAPAA